MAGATGLVVSLIDGSQVGGTKRIQRALGLEDPDPRSWWSRPNRFGRSQAHDPWRGRRSWRDRIGSRMETGRRSTWATCRTPFTETD